MPQLIDSAVADGGNRPAATSENSIAPEPARLAFPRSTAGGTANVAAPRRSPISALLAQLLEEQRTLTAVEQFACRHQQHALPAQAKYYRDLIPLARPQAGEQYAFIVDLDRCSGCKACVSACHSLNGLEHDETWRSVGLLVGVPSPAGSSREPGDDRLIFGLQHVTTACHHCVDPGCLNGCPVLAYEKDPATGIVRHLDDQCIGCRYCVLKCPYDVPKYSTARGIVRKCDLCHSRLAADEAPACVQACPHEAIRIEIVNQSAARSLHHGAPISGTACPEAAPAVLNRFLPGSPDPRITLPTTRYLSSKPLAPAKAADADALRLEPAHWPLVFMLVLTQLAGGLHLLHAVLFGSGWAEPLPVLARVAWCALWIGLAASVAHLGRPLKAWRAFLGWRRSWMSREILALAAYGGLATLLVAFPGSPATAGATAVAALVAIACSAMVYVDTGRPSWSAGVVFETFFGTTLLLGATAGAMWAGWLAPDLAPSLAALATILRAAWFAGEASLLRARRDPASPRHRAALTAWRLLRPLLAARAGLFTASMVFSILTILNAAGRGVVWGTLACAATFASQVLERYTFFAACAPPRMPGGVAV